MKKLLLLTAWISISSIMLGDDFKEEIRYIGLLHQLQYVETIEDLKKLIPDCPPPHPDAGDDNSEITVNTKLFGCDAVGEFNFHKDVLVSHGFQLRPKNFDDAHEAFLKASAILDSQIKALESSVALPIDKGEGDCPSAPLDRITIYLNGVHANASYQMRLELRAGIQVLAWGAQKERRTEKLKIEQDAKLDSLVGKWESISGEMNGIKIDKTTKTFIEFDKANITLNGGKAVKYSIDDTKTPATLDIHSAPMQVGILKFVNGELHLCLGKEGHRPTEFKSDNGDDCVLFVMRKSEADQK